MARARIKGVIVCKKPGNLNRFSKKMEGRKEGKMEGRRRKTETSKKRQKMGKKQEELKEKMMTLHE